MFRRRWFRGRCKNGHTWFWRVDDRTGVAVEGCWFCAATRGIERMAPKHRRRTDEET